LQRKKKKVEEDEKEEGRGWSSWMRRLEDFWGLVDEKNSQRKKEWKRKWKMKKRRREEGEELFVWADKTPLSPSPIQRWVVSLEERKRVTACPCRSQSFGSERDDYYVTIELNRDFVHQIQSLHAERQVADQSIQSDCVTPLKILHPMRMIEMRQRKTINQNWRRRKKTKDKRPWKRKQLKGLPCLLEVVEDVSQMSMKLTEWMKRHPSHSDCETQHLEEEDQEAWHPSPQWIPCAQSATAGREEGEREEEEVRV
jgi:hypothetical protein